MMYLKNKYIVTGLGLVAVSTLISFFISGPGNSKQETGTKKPAASALGSVSTGIATLGYDTAHAAQFQEHSLKGLQFPNGLYQGFLAVHYDEMDTVYAFHSAVGRTNARRFPGDTNTFRNLRRGTKTTTTRIDSQKYSFSLPGRDSNITIDQIQYAYRDSSQIIHLDMVITFKRRNVSDTARFTNVRIMLGYDGDIGSSLSGYSDDSCGYYADDTAKVAYIFDHPDTASVFFTGIQYLGGGLSDTAGNIRLMHQTVNDTGKTLADLDTFLYSVMQSPGFHAEYQKTDVTVYWMVNLGDIAPDTLTGPISDTIRFAFINGVTMENLIRSAHGQKVRMPDTEPAPVIPDKFRLYQNYPNPFNNGTDIRYDISDNGVVTLKIYNILGQEVRTLVNSPMSKGAYTALWDGRDNKGAAVASGLYFYRITAKKFTASRKMVLVK